MKPVLASAHEAFVALDGSLDATQRSWLEQVPLARAIEAVDSQPVDAPVTFVAPAVRAFGQEVTALGGEAWLDKYLRFVLLALLVRTQTRPLDYVLPPSVGELLDAERTRIVEDVTARDAEPYNMGGAFIRDWGFCLGTALPFGIAAGQVGASLRRDMLARAGLAHLGESPWLNLHLDIRGDRKRYTAEARELSGLRIADFMRHNLSYQGMFGVGWLSDPAVSEISPHHTATREEIVDSGAILLRRNSGDDATVILATATSKTRRRLYEERQYTPTDYMTIWPRDDFIRWREAAVRRAQPE
jgi:hypothetical protein